MKIHEVELEEAGAMLDDLADAVLRGEQVLLCEAGKVRARLEPCLDNAGQWVREEPLNRP